MDKWYQATPDAYCGDKDNGQTSAWYIFLALGFYPVTPATDKYVWRAPLFKHAINHLENGNSMKINAPESCADHLYVNNQACSKNYLSHKELMKGAFLNNQMDKTPNKKRGSEEKDFPHSISKEK